MVTPTTTAGPATATATSDPVRTGLGALGVQPDTFRPAREARPDAERPATARPDIRTPGSIVCFPRAPVGLAMGWHRARHAQRPLLASRDDGRRPQRDKAPNPSSAASPWGGHTTTRCMSLRRRQSFVTLWAVCGPLPRREDNLVLAEGRRGPRRPFTASRLPSTPSDSAKTRRSPTARRHRLA
jgi:hypothetical protein